MSRFTPPLRRRSLAMAAVLVLIVGLVPIAGFSAAAPVLSAPISAALEKDGKATAWVVLKARADLAPAYGISDWNRRGQFVYDQLTRTAEQSQANVRALLKARGANFSPFWIVNAIKVTADAKTFTDVAADAGVASVIPDPTYEILPDSVPTPGEVEAAVQAAGAGTTSIEWNIQNIGAPAVWSTYGDRGEGIVVATIDTGAQYNHPALVNSYRGNLGNGLFDHNYDWYDPSNVCGSPSLVPCDNNGHGTHTMGTIVGDDGGANQIGVAPGARWIAAKGCESGSCTTTALVNAGQWMLAPRDLNGQNPRADLRPQVVSNSWGNGNGADTFYQSIVQSWIASGIFPVFANGNAGPSCGTVGAPGSYPESFGVGAYDVNNAIASFSSRGPGTFAGDTVKPDISAPGVAVRSAYPTSSYSSLSGTSMATPHVAGVVALMLSAAPALVGDIATTKSLLRQSARPVSDLTCGGTASDNNVWGAGRLDASTAVFVSPRGAVGRLTGTVRDAVTGQPVPGATIAVTGTASRTITANASGVYGITLSASGTYDLAVSKFAYDTSSATGITIVQDATTVTDVAMTAAATYTVSGTVRDSAGAPLPGAKVRIVGTPLPDATPDSSGAYSIAGLPAGTWSFTAVSPDRCSADDVHAYTIGGSTSGLDLAPPKKVDGFGHWCQVETASWVSGTTRVPLFGDDTYYALYLPFPFSYDGTTRSVAYFSTNGALNFLNYDSNLSHVAIPATSTPNAALFPFWDDLVVDSKASVWTATLGTAPNRTFLVEWRNLRPFGYADTTTIRMSFEVLLSESGEIVFNYQGLDSTTARALGSNATIGIENPTGSAGIAWSYNESALRNGLALHFFGPVSDVTAPTAPGSFTATGASTTSMDLGWSAATDNVAVAGYTISRDGTQIATVAAGTTSYTDTGLVQGRDYVYSIVARDGAGNVGPAATATGTTMGDGVAPSVPGGLRVTAASTATLTLTWNAATDNVGVTGYRVYANGTLLGSTTSTTYGAPTPAGPTTYTVSAIDAVGNESGTAGQTAIAWPGYDASPPVWAATATLTVVSQTSNKWTLSWTSASDDLTGLSYRIYTTGGKLVATTTTTSWTGNKQRGVVYYVVAVDIAGNQSTQTNQVTG